MLAIILIDFIEDFSSLFKNIAAFSLFNIETIRYSEFISAVYKNKLMNCIPTDIIIACEVNFYKHKTQQVSKYLKKVFPSYQPKILKLFVGKKGKFKKKISIEDNDVFFLYHPLKSKLQSLNLTCCFLRLFNEATLNFQLYDYLSTSVKEMIGSELLKEKQREIEKLNIKLDQKSKIDYLTSLYNRGALYSLLKQEISRIKRQMWRIEELDKQLINDQNNKIEKKKPDKKSPYNRQKGNITEHIGKLSIMMIDIDHFKKINDTYGHLIGDYVLKSLSHKLFHSNIFRVNDVVARFGGEEFIVILPETNAENARIAALKLVKNLQAIEFQAGNNTFQIQFTIGITELRPDDKSEDDLIKRADKALYWGKHHGRNKIVLFSEIKNG